MRGKDPVSLWCSVMKGITPACAGKRPVRWAKPDLWKDHPRACGEKRCPAETSLPPTGSPPRMRGKEGAVLVQLCKDGITPAHAGKSANTIADMPGDWDHPRTCGEKRQLQHGRHQRLGSPPRMRGKVGLAFLHAVSVRITPACAGKRWKTGCAAREPGDHPRTCGEKIYSVRDNIAEQGSPPHMRGKAGGDFQ